MEQRVLVRLAAWLAPLPAVLAMVAGLSWDDTDEREQWNAGQVLGGRIHRDGIGRVMDDLAEERHRVWVLGNSNANTDIDRDDLAEGLEIPPKQVLVLSVPNANTAHWLSMLRRLEDARRSPDLILVVSRLQLVLVDTPISESARRSLQALLRPSDTDLVDLARPRGEWVGTVVDRREAVRDRIGRELRVALPYTVGVARPETLLRRALSDDRIDVDLLGPPPPRPLPSPEASLVPRLGDLAQELKTRIVVVRPPASPLAGSEQADVVPEGYVERTRELLESHGITFVDMTDLPMKRHHYKNIDHLDLEGARRLTSAILTALHPDEGHDALGRVSLVTGEVSTQRGQLTYPDDVPAVPVDSAESTDGARPGVRWTDAPVGVPPDNWTMGVTQLHTRCSPLRVRTPEGMLQANISCRRLRRDQSCHGPDRVGFSVSHADTWSLVLDPGRSCEGAAWLYPKDELRIRWPESQRVSSATHVRLAGHSYRPRTLVTYTVRRDGRALSRGRLNNQGEPVEIELGDGDGPPTVILRSNHYALVTTAELIRR